MPRWVITRTRTIRLSTRHVLVRGSGARRAGYGATRSSLWVCVHESLRPVLYHLHPKTSSIAWQMF